MHPTPQGPRRAVAAALSSMLRTFSEAGRLWGHISRSYSAFPSVTALHNLMLYVSAPLTLQLDSGLETSSVDTVLASLLSHISRSYSASAVVYTASCFTCLHRWHCNKHFGSKTIADCTVSNTLLLCKSQQVLSSSPCLSRC